MIKKDINYMEGFWVGERMLSKIETTVYKTLEGAINAKSVLVRKFEEDFGFSREMEEMDSKYAYNCGMLDAFLQAQQEEE